MDTQIETVVIGGGQAGIAMSYHLKQRGLPHLVLEKTAQPVDAWRNQRWDSFTLVTPNWTIRMPGGEYAGDDPDGFLPRDEIVRYFDEYVTRYALPIRCNTTVTAVEPAEGGWRVVTAQERFHASNVIIAAGLFQTPKIPAFAANLPAHIQQLHSTAYRNPAQLAPGAVVVVGSAQSGCQIAEELYQSGRKVYLCTGSTGRAPRSYRGRDIFYWLQAVGFFARTADKLPSPRAKFAPNPQASGTNGGHEINLHQFARDGVILLGRIRDIQGETVYLAPDLKENLAKSDGFYTMLVTSIDKYIAGNNLDLPTQELASLNDGYAAEDPPEVNLAERGITSIIWASGYRFDFRWIKAAVLDEDGFPIQQRGVTALPGLYFLGLPWLNTQKSGLLWGVGDDAAHLAEHLVSRHAA